MKFVLLSIFLWLFISTSYAQQINTRKLDSFLTTLSSKGVAMGSMAISKKGQPTYLKELSPATLYRIGSVTKLFTAVLVFQLIEEKKLSLDQKLSRFYPDLPNAESISIEDMLYHRTGLHDYTKDTDFTTWMDQPKSQAELLTIIKQKGSDFQPREKSEYSNSNFLLLGYIIESISKKSYAEVLKNRISDPLQLKNTWFGTEANVKQTQAPSFKYNTGNWIPEKSTDLRIHGGAGAIISRPDDLIRFINALFANKLISQASLASMKTIVNEYGMGIFVNKYGSKKSYGHNGRIEEFYTAVWHYPKDSLSIAYCTNGIHYPRTDLIEGVLKICFDEPFDLPFGNNKKIDLNNYTGTYSNEQITVKCTVTGTRLAVETRGIVFELEQIAENYFMHSSSGYYFEFLPLRGELQIKETDNIYYLKKTKE
ncbi:MAG: beta-lactamase family protein [Flavihumibacter sp.]|nr:beta-lactamase family protein [Flavihumibacter sp.]